MSNQKEQTGEGRRLTAAWLNIMAAGLISGGTVPVLYAFAAEGWGAHVRTLMLLPLLTFALGTALHLLGRAAIRNKASAEVLRYFPLACLGRQLRNASVDEGTRCHGAFATEREIDAVLIEFGNDARAAIRALLHDLDAMASDNESAVSEGAIPSIEERTKRNRSRAGGRC
jgi:hypothetical protein